MVYALLGTLQGWTLRDVAALTFRQFKLLGQGQGRMLYPRLKPLLDAQFAQVSDNPVGEDKESGVDRILREHREMLDAIQEGRTIPQTPKQKKRNEAYRIQFAQYLPHEEVKRKSAKPRGKIIPELPAKTAQAVMAFAQAGGFTAHPDIWARDVVPILADLQVTANQKGADKK